MERRKGLSSSAAPLPLPLRGFLRVYTRRQLSKMMAAALRHRKLKIVETEIYPSTWDLITLAPICPWLSEYLARVS